MKKQAFLFVAGGETYQMIRGTPLRLAQTYILVNARGWRPWCPSIQCSVPLGAGGFFPKIASQRALVARGGLCEFGARSNWPPGMPALIVFPNCCNCVNNLVLLPLEKWWDPISFSSKVPSTHFLFFSHPGIGRGWKCVEALIPATDQGVVPPWMKIVETFDICLLKYLRFLPLWAIVFCIFCYNIQRVNFYLFIPYVYLIIKIPKKQKITRRPILCRI